MLADGTRLHVSHPERILHPTGSRNVVGADKDDRVKVLDVVLLLAIEMDTPTAAGTVSEDDGGEE
jgi:hypothetical protein